jgi:hypothetical protein
MPVVIPVVLVALVSAWAGGFVGRVSGFRRVRSRAVLTVSALVLIAVVVDVLLVVRVVSLTGF